MIRVSVLAFAVLAGCLAGPPANTTNARAALPDSAIEALFAMRPRDGQGLSLSYGAYRQLTHLIRRAVRERREPSACVAPHGYRMKREGARHIADVWLLTIAEADSADSVDVWWHDTLCGDSLPSVHGHMGACATIGCWPMELPSPTDVKTAYNRRAPFHLLIYPQGDSVAVRLYWVMDNYPFWDTLGAKGQRYEQYERNEGVPHGWR